MRFQISLTDPKSFKFCMETMSPSASEGWYLSSKGCPRQERVKSLQTGATVAADIRKACLHCQHFIQHTGTCSDVEDTPMAPEASETGIAAGVNGLWKDRSPP